MIGIYKITNPKGKIYIGSSVNIERRFKEYRTLKKSKGQLLLHRSFNKYGIENHIFSIETECILEDLYKLENYYSSLYDTLNNNLNLSIPKLDQVYGGHSEETKRKISNSNKGKIFTEETLKKMSASKKITQLGINNSFYSKNHTDDFKLNHSKNRMYGKNPNAKIILDREFGIYYESVTEAADLLKCNKGHLAAQLRGNKKNKTKLIYV